VSTPENLFKISLDCKRIKPSVIPNVRAAGGGICSGGITGQKQIPPQASPSFGMTDFSGAWIFEQALS
jgi:hypothetical protein